MDTEELIEDEEMQQEFDEAYYQYEISNIQHSVEVRNIKTVLTYRASRPDVC